MHELIREGLPNAEIAVRLGISINTVRYHVSNLLSKSGLRSRQELVEWTPGRSYPRGIGWLLPLPTHLWKIGGYSAAAVSGLLVVGVILSVLTTTRVGSENESIGDEPGVASLIGAGIGALLIDYSPREGWDPGVPGSARGALVAIDSATGEERSDWGPLNMGQAGRGVVSPDGAMVALITHTGQASAGALSVVRVEDATEVVAFPQPRLRGEVVWLPGGSKLLGLTGIGWSGPPRLHLWSFDIQTGTSEQLGEFDFDVMRTEISPGGDLLYILAFRALECCGIDVQGDPFIAVIDVKTGSLTKEIPLPGLVLGQRFESRGQVGAESEYNIIRWPATAVSPHGDLLYIAHADSPEITVVNVERGEVEVTAEPIAASSRLERFARALRSFVVSEASAKSGVYFEKQLSVSSDGRWLYLAGTKDELCPPPHLSCVSNAPIGFSIIEADSLRISSTFEKIGRFALSPNGRTIVGWSNAYDIDVAGVTEHNGAGPIIIDARAQRQRHAMQLPSPYYAVQVSPDGRHAYILARGPNFVRDRYECDSACTILSIINLETGQVVATRELAATYLSFIGLAPEEP